MTGTESSILCLLAQCLRSPIEGLWDGDLEAELGPWAFRIAQVMKGGTRDKNKEVHRIAEGFNSWAASLKDKRSPGKSRTP